MVKWRQLTTKADYKKALDRVNILILMDTPRSDEIQNELILLSYLIEEYEEQYYPLPDASPIGVVRFMMEMKGIKQKDLIPILGTKGNVSKILSGAAKIQLEMLDPLSQFLGIPVESLIPKRSTGIVNRILESVTQTVVAESAVRYRKHKR